jgi:hypothetical protein
MRDSQGIGGMECIKTMPQFLLVFSCESSVWLTNNSGRNRLYGWKCFGFKLRAHVAKSMFPRKITYGDKVECDVKAVMLYGFSFQIARSFCEKQLVFPKG